MPRLGSPLLLALVAALPLEPGALGAEPPPTPAAEAGEEIVIHGPARPAQAEAALAPGAAVTVIDVARFAGEAKGLAELVGTSPGVAVTEHGGILRPATMSIRGSSAEQVKVLLDGVPLNPSAGGGVDLSTIPSQWISRVEVVRGTEGVHHGSGALGGVVNVVTAPPRPGTWSASATGGSFETWLADAQSGIGGERWGVLGSVAAAGSSGRFPYEYDDHNASTPGLTSAERAHDGAVQAGGLVKGFLLAADGRLDGAAQLSGGRRDLPGPLGNLTFDDWQEDARGLFSLRFRRPAAGGLFVTAATSTRLDVVAVRLAELGGVVTRQRGVATTASGAVEWCGAPGSAQVGIEGGEEWLTGDGLGRHARSTVAATVAGEVSTRGGRLRAGPGVRVEQSGGYSGISAKLGGSITLGGPLSLRASAGRTHRVPSFAELFLQQGVVEPNPALRPEVGVGGDAAFVADGRLGTASLGAFATLYRDLVVYQAASFRRFRPENVARSVVRGIEADLVTAPLREVAGLSTAFAYTFTSSATLRGVESVLEKDLPHKPRHRLYARLSGGGASVGAHAETQWISRQFLDFANNAPIPSALTFAAGAYLSLHRPTGLRLHAEVRNLLDDRSIQDGFGNPLPGRTVLVTLRAGGSTPGEP